MMAHKSKGKTLYAINILLVKKRALREKEATTDTNPLSSILRIVHCQNIGGIL